MNERVKHEGALWPWVAGAAVLAALLSVGTYFYFRESRKPPIEQVSSAPAFKEVTAIMGAKVKLKVYFPTKDGMGLSPETRDVAESADKPREVKDLVTVIIRGPLSAELSPALPPESRVKSVFIDPSTGTAYIDFSQEVQTQFPGGAWTETLAIYSVTNTLTEDFPEIKQVQILVEGNVTESLAGHIDISKPFMPRTALNRE